jgi:AraC-like DNA-binding protein
MLRPVRIKHYLDAMRTRGIPVADVLHGTSIDSTRLTDAGYLIEPWECRRVITNMIARSDDPGIGFEVGRLVEPQDLGITGYAVLSSPNMRQVLSLWSRYSGPLVGMISRMDLHEDANGGLDAEVMQPDRTDPIYVFCVEELMAMMFKLGAQLAGSPPEVERVEFSYPAPRHSFLYHQLFKCPIRFDGERTSASLTRDWLDRPSSSNDEEFNRICVSHCGKILHQIEHSTSVVSRIRSLLLRNPRDIPKMEAVAQSIGQSARSLRRHLQNEGSSYQQIVDEFRRDLAMEYLNSTHMSVKEIAYALGYADHAAFRKAFKTWTGQPPVAYRTAVLGSGVAHQH